MFVLQPGAGDHSDKELASVCVRTPVRHRHEVRLLESVLFWTQLICKILPPNRLSPCAVAVWTPCLGHEPLYHSMENQAIIKALLRQFNEVLACLWSVINKKLNVNVSHCSLEDDLALFGGFLLEFLDHQFFFIWPLINDVPNVVRCEVRLSP